MCHMSDILKTASIYFRNFLVHSDIPSVSFFDVVCFLSFIELFMVEVIDLHFVSWSSL